MKQFLIAIKATAIIVLLIVAYGIFKEHQYGSVRRLERLMDVEFPESEVSIVSKEEVIYDATTVINHIDLREPLSADTKATIESRCSDPQNEAWELYTNREAYGLYWDYVFIDSNTHLVCYIGERAILAEYIVRDNDYTTVFLIIASFLWGATLLIWGAVLAIRKLRHRLREK